MATKRKIDDILEETPLVRKVAKIQENVKKHTLDSDEEEENDEAYNVLDENEIEGEEDGFARQEGEQKMTAFNMEEEKEMGHFDKDGHFLWNNEKEVKDNWLDNIDWVKVNDKHKGAADAKGLGDDSDSETEVTAFNEIDTYTKIITYLKPKETITKALRRFGGDTTKLSSVERLKRKKAGTLTSCQEVTELTELANEVLTQMGNMDVYQETFEQITLKIANHNKKTQSKAKIVEAELDMYADDFDNQEKQKKQTDDTEMDTDQASGSAEVQVGPSEASNMLLWEFKWEQDKDKIEGPFNTEQMNTWSIDGYFKTGVWVRKCGAADSNFYSSNRIDFELYL